MLETVMKRSLKKYFGFLLFLTSLSCSLLYVSGQANTVIKNLSYEWHPEGLLITIETQEPSNIVCHSVKNPPSIIIASPDEFFTSQPSIVKIGNTIKRIKAVRGLKKTPEELDPAYYNVSFFVVDLNKPKKFVWKKEDTRFLLTIEEDMAIGTKKPLYKYVGDIIEKINPPEEVYDPKKLKKEKSKEAELKKKAKELDISEEPPSPAKKEKPVKAPIEQETKAKEIPEERASAAEEKKSRDTQMEEALKKISEQDETKKKQVIEELVKQEKKSIEDARLKMKKEPIEKEKIKETQPREVKKSEEKPKLKPQSKEPNDTKKSLKNDSKKLFEIDEVVKSLSVKEEKQEKIQVKKVIKEEAPKKEPKPVIKEKSSKPRTYRQDKSTQETIRKLGNLKSDMDKAIDDRIQAELLKDEATRQWEESKEELDEVFSK